MGNVEMRQFKLRLDKILTGKEDKCECCFVILSGTCQVYFPQTGVKWDNIGKRRDVFQGKASLIYIPKDTEYEILACTDNVEVVQILTEARKKLVPFVVDEKNIKCECRGEGSYQRYVYNLLDCNSMTENLIVGETIHQGTWSGFPPHKHDIENYPKELNEKEMYYIKVSPPSAFGVFINYTSSIKEGIATILTDDSYITVDSGFHCIVSTPECKFYYLWALSHEKKEVIYSLDKNFALDKNQSEL